jgi:hypothetical protein
MSKILFELDPARGLRIDYEELEGGGVALHYSQDVEPVLDLNKDKRNTGRSYYAHDPDMWRVASIPIVVQYEWARRYGIRDVTAPEYEPLLRRLLNDPEWSYLKTAEIVV